ncbi:leucine-rich repeat protein 1 [Fopius arisanus]|uniref:Leucine-rich repeat protein 1 n=3 Tax=Fopius arisanus TaxID=64838 RepID=A0A9R1T7Y9_9HYME|nr:PREDICTED: leucine-rich repeat protein 1 [Fopius arisanus]
MKINCNVEVVNRSVCAPRKKAQRSCLAIGRQSVKSNELHLLLQTLQNKLGTKYKIDENIEKVFTKFVNNGKTTIRLKEPPHDLNIQCDPILLKSFLRTLELGVTKKLNASVLCVSNMNAKNIAQAPKTKVTIKSKSDYPVLEGFPRTTEELNIVGLERKSFDRQILKLHRLRVLNLSDNKITSLPRELGALSCLTELIVANNGLGHVGKNKWSWMSEGSLSRTLKLLDLSGNELTDLPNQIGRLRNLVTLNVSHNNLRSLPTNVGTLSSSLKYLDISHNSIESLPGGMMKFTLEGLNIAHNPHISRVKQNGFNINFRVLTLTQLGAQKVIHYRLDYDASIIPFTLVSYLDNASYCVCGEPVLGEDNCLQVSRNVSQIAKEVTASEDINVSFQCVLCSLSCAQSILFPR